MRNHCGWGRPPATGDKEETCLSYQGQRWQSGVGGHRAEKGDGREKPQNGSGGEENLNLLYSTWRIQFEHNLSLSLHITIN